MTTAEIITWQEYGELWHVACLEARERAGQLQRTNKELCDLVCDLQQRIGQLEVLLDRANMERDVLRERVDDLNRFLDDARLER